MSVNVLPIVVTVAALPPGFTGTPQELAEAIAARLQLVTSQSFALFVAGSTEPGFDSGPWNKDGRQWWFYDTTTGRYAPFTIPQESLKFFVGLDAPDPSQFLVWFQLNGAGEPVAIKTYYNGAWTSAYYLKSELYSRTELDALFEPTVAGKKQILYANVIGTPAAATQVAFRARKASVQVFTAGVAEQMTFATTEYAIGGGYSANVFTAPVAAAYHFDCGFIAALASGSPTAISFELRIVRNSSEIIAEWKSPANNDTGIRGDSMGTDTFLEIGDTVDVVLSITSTGASTWDCSAGAATFFNAHRASF